mmetsp:Transcript_14315/g.21839  ORF Transcript_14315/g.21839 Transcript_14315/m.21839 type:complete len:87 (+) Transcript_14315:222-482(+)
MCVDAKFLNVKVLKVLAVAMILLLATETVRFALGITKKTNLLHFRSSTSQAARIPPTKPLNMQRVSKASILKQRLCPQAELVRWER